MRKVRGPKGAGYILETHLNMLESSAGDTAWWNQHRVPGEAAGCGICILFGVLQ